MPDATGPQSPIAIPDKIPTSGRLDSGCSQLIDLPEALQIRIAQSESSCSSREFVSSCQALRKRVPMSTWFRKPSERTVWATPNKLPLAPAVTQSCENKASSRMSWSPSLFDV